MLAPGLKAILSLFFKLGTALVLLITSLRFAGIYIPAFHIVAAIALGGPAFIALRIISNEYSLRRAARLSGARLVPRVTGRGLGNIRLPFDDVRISRTGYFGDHNMKLMEELGSTTVDMNILWEPLIFTTNPEHAQRILATDFETFEKGKQFQEAAASVLGSGVFNSDGDMWKFHRSVTRPFFTRDRISHCDLFSRYSDDSIRIMKNRLSSGHPVDMQDLFGRFTIAVAAEFLFGTRLDTLSAPLLYPHHSTGQAAMSTSSTSDTRFADAFRDAQEALMDRIRLGNLWPMLEIGKDKTADSMKAISAYLEPIIAAAVEKEKAKAKAGNLDKEVDDDETLLDNLVRQTTDPAVLKDETLNIMVAARDTTTATLTFAVYFLSMYPDVMKRLREEVVSTLGPSGRPTYQNIKEMRYLRAVINETLRLYPAVPVNIRVSNKASVWPSPDPNLPPLYIPAGARCIYSVLMMHRRKDLWGPDAEEFDPDRFLDERLKKYLTPKPFIFLPFNAGPRICLGQQFAYNEISFMLVRLVQAFESFSLDTDAFPLDARPPKEFREAEGRKKVEKIWPKNTLTIYSKGGLWMRATEASEDL